jgi:hypothetical protein
MEQLMTIVLLFCFLAWIVDGPTGPVVWLIRLVVYILDLLTSN